MDVVLRGSLKLAKQKLGGYLDLVDASFRWHDKDLCKVGRFPLSRE